MSEKRMLIVPAELVKKVDENRGDMSQSDFINFLIDSRLEQKTAEQTYVTKDSLKEFEQGIKDLLRSFVEFFVSYGLEVGRRSDKDEDLEMLRQRLKGAVPSLDLEHRKAPKV